MRAAIYARVSTEEQAREGVSLDAQQQACLAFCRSQGWTVADIYVDDGYSAKDTDRPALQRLLADAKGRRFDAVLVWRLDRWSRRQAHCLRLVEDDLGGCGVGFKSATESFDTTTPGGKAMFGMLAVFAQLERETIIERTRSALVEAVRQKRWPGGPVPYGYRQDADGSLRLDHDTATVVETLFAEAAAGRSVKALAALMDARCAPKPRGGEGWLRGSVRGIIASRFYLGEMRWRGEWHAGQHEALIPQAVWDAANAALGTRHNRPTHRSLLGGVAYCARCGSKLRFHRNGSRGYKYDWYECTGRAEHKNCDLPVQPVAEVDALVLERLALAAADARAMREHLDSLSTQSAAALRREDSGLARQEAEAKRRLQVWYEAVETGAMPFSLLRERMTGLEREREATGARRREIAELLARAGNAKSRASEVLHSLRRFRADLPTMDADRRRAAVRWLLAKVRVEDGPTVTELTLR